MNEHHSPSDKRPTNEAATVGSAEDLSPEALARLADVDLVARSLVKGFLQGHHQSADRGSSTEFLSHRPYVTGDAIHHVDWRTFARTDRFYLKEYRDETNLRATLILDTSASMGCPDLLHSGGAEGKEYTKLWYGKCLAAAMAHLLTHQRDAVGLATIADDVQGILRPKASAAHLAGLLSILQSTEARGETQLGTALTRLSAQLPRRSLVILISDFFDDAEVVTESLARLRHERDAEIIVFHLIDSKESEFPFEGWTLFEDPENPSRRLRVDARWMRNVFLENQARHLETLSLRCRSAAIDYCRVDIRERFESALSAYLYARRQRTKTTS